MTYFQNLQELLTIEQQEDRAQHKKLQENTTIQQRRDAGLAWYPLIIKDVEPTKGDYINVVAERTTQHNEPHQLRYGMPVVFFSNHNAAADRIEGIISFCKGNTVKIHFRTEELPDWASNGKLGVDLLFDENSYKEMQQALTLSIKAYEDPKNRLVKILLGEKQATANIELPKIYSKNLNEVQQQAVQHIVQANELCIVHGPPGTGKTTTLIQAIIAMLQQGAKKILVTAPSNTAVDVVSEKLALNGIKVLRIGNPIRVSETLQSLTLDERINNHPTNKEIKKLKRQASDFKEMAHKYKRNFGVAEREQRKALFTEARKIMQDVENMENYIIKDVLDNTQVVIATLVSSNNYIIRDMEYDAVVIDEAGQAIEPACWIPILKTKKVILAGDHCQLPPTIKSHAAAQKGLEKTLLEKCVALHPNAVTLLQVQYRMHEQIMEYSNRHFYNSKLIAHASVQHHTITPTDKPVTFIDTAGTGYTEKINGTQISNIEEATLLLNHLSAYLEQLNIADNKPPTIAVISPYKMQVVLLQEYALHHPILQQYSGSISINTIDSFQGQEKDIIYISLVRSNDEGTIGFLSDLRRMNVAMTRARKKLVIFGDSATLSTHPFYNKLVEYTQSIDSWMSAWEIMN